MTRRRSGAFSQLPWCGAVAAVMVTLPTASRTAVSLSAVVCSSALAAVPCTMPMLHQRGSGPVEVMT